MNKVLLLVISVVIISCSKTNTNIQTVNSMIENTNKEEAAVINEKEKNYSPVMLDKITFYHAELAEMNSIKSNEISKDWKRIYIFTKDNIQQFQNDLLGDDMSISLKKDLDKDGIVEQIITGTYVDNYNNEGNFIAIISESKLRLVCKSSDQPTLIHFRTFDDVIYFGSGFAGEYRKKITWKNSEFRVSDVLPE